MIRPQFILDINDEIIVDNFAGGGGASTGIEQALGRHVDVAINHDPEAVAMHQANHPQTRHYCESVWDVNPREVEPGRAIGLLWLSPDCKHFSKAKGGKPVEKKIRGLAWVALRWAAIRKPRVIMLENVEEFITWGPLTEGADGKLRPCPKRKGREFNAFRNALQRHGYTVEWKELRACDYGAPTIRKRLFLIARRDGLPIVWPQPTHFDPRLEDKRHRERGEHRRQAWHTAAECIDFTLPCPSIFERKKPLAEATLRRIAKGIMRYVVNAAEPFIVGAGGPTYSGKPKSVQDPFGALTAENHRALVAPVITRLGQNGGNGIYSNSVEDPLTTVVSKNDYLLVAPTLVQTGYGEREGQSPRAPGLDKPLGTVVAGGAKHALVAAFLAQFNTTGNGKPNVGHAATEPVSTVLARGTQQGLVTANLVHYHSDKRAADVRASSPDEPIKTQTTENRHALVTSNLIKMRGDNVGQPDDEPLHTVSAQGTHFAEVRAFLIKYYGTDQDPQMREPLHTVTTKDRYGLVTVAGEEYAITDIGLRMLAPRELFRAQGFPEHYIIGDNPEQGLTLTKSAQVRMCGNSVCPPLAAALVRANLADMAVSNQENRRSA